MNNGLKVKKEIFNKQFIKDVKLSRELIDACIKFTKSA